VFIGKLHDNGGFGHGREVIFDLNRGVLNEPFGGDVRGNFELVQITVELGATFEEFVGGINGGEGNGVVFEVAGLGEVIDELAGHGFEMAQRNLARQKALDGAAQEQMALAVFGGIAELFVGKVESGAEAGDMKHLAAGRLVLFGGLEV
jgi:hypothetical protein